MERDERQGAPAPAEKHGLPAAAPPPDYWGRASGAYRILFRILLIALPIFIVLFAIVCAGAFSYDSVLGFLRDIRSASSFVPAEYRTVTYSYEEGDCTVLPLGGGVAAVNGGGIEIFSPDGTRLLDVPAELHAPRAVSSGKRLLVYDFGGTDFTVTDAYAKLHGGLTDFPICLAAIGESGRFALVTTSDEHLSQVVVYDANFHPIQRFGRASATTGVALSDNGRYVALAGILAEEGKTQSVLELYRIGATEPTFSCRPEGENALALSFTDDRHVALLTDRALRVYGTDGKITQEIALEEGVPAAFAANDGGCVLAVRKDAFSAFYRVIVLNKKGKITYDENYTGDIGAVALCEGHAFLLEGETVARVTLKDGQIAKGAIAPGATGLFAIDGARVRVIYAAEALYYVF